MSFCVLDCNRTEHYSFACWPTLPVGRRRPHNNSRIRAIPSEEYSYVVATRSFPVAVGRERDTYGCASLSYY